MSQARNRRPGTQPASTPLTPDTIPMAHPDRSGPKTKTLFDIASERNALLAKGRPFSPIHGDGLVRDENGRVILPAKASSSSDETSGGGITIEEIPRHSSPGHGKTADNDDGNDDDDDEELIGPLGNSLLYTLTLSMLHFTLSLLVHNQYGQAPPTLWPLLVETARTAPVLFVGVLVMKLPGVTVLSRGAVKQGLHFLLGTASGTYLVWMGNRANYLAVMKRAPSLGVVWIWCVVEMRLECAVASLGLVGIYVWWNGFSTW